MLSSFCLLVTVKDLGTKEDVLKRHTTRATSFACQTTEAMVPRMLRFTGSLMLGGGKVWEPTPNLTGELVAQEEISTGHLTVTL